MLRLFAKKVFRRLAKASLYINDFMYRHDLFVETRLGVSLYIEGVNSVGLKIAQEPILP